MSGKSITVALAGNPNSGKSTIFSNLTGARQKTGNWPGVTVEKKEGHLSAHGYSLTIVDLPGTYSLTAYSIEEIVARNFVLDEKPDVVVAIIDASNLERNLYLATQLRELDTKVIFVLNMVDVAKARGVEIDAAKLSRALGAPVFPTVARSGEGKKDLIDAATGQIVGKKRPEPLQISYGEDIDNLLAEMEKRINNRKFLTDTYPARWIALKYLENDQQIQSLGAETDQELSQDLENIKRIY